MHEKKLSQQMLCLKTYLDRNKGTWTKQRWPNTKIARCLSLKDQKLHSRYHTHFNHLDGSHGISYSLLIIVLPEVVKFVTHIPITAQKYQLVSPCTFYISLERENNVKAPLHTLKPSKKFKTNFEKLSTCAHAVGDNYKQRKLTLQWQHSQIKYIPQDMIQLDFSS